VRRILTFGFVGLAGAVVHMVAFEIVRRIGATGHSAAWVLSFFVAASSTWAMNRAFTFADRRNTRQSSEWAAYVLVAGAGALAHFAVFWLVVNFVGFFIRTPAMGIIPGSLASFMVTYFGASRLVFTPVKEENPKNTP
jgi:putative flippase GtrA